MSWQPIIKSYYQTLPRFKAVSAYSIPDEHLCAVNIQKALVDLVNAVSLSHTLSRCRTYIGADEVIRSLGTLHVDVLSVDVRANLRVLEPLLL